MLALLKIAINYVAGGHWWRSLMVKFLVACYQCKGCSSSSIRKRTTLVNKPYNWKLGVFLLWCFGIPNLPSYLGKVANWCGIDECIWIKCHSHVFMQFLILNTVYIVKKLLVYKRYTQKYLKKLSTQFPAIFLPICLRAVTNLDETILISN